MNWKIFGFKATKKIVYYAIIICAIVFLGETASRYMTEKDTCANVIGFMLAAVTIGATITIGGREISQICNYMKNKQTNKEQTNKE